MFEKFINSRYTLPLIYVVIIFMLITYKAFGQTPQQVYNTCIEEHIQHPEIVTKQFILETGWGKSNICIMNCNLFGMKLAHQRQTTAIGEHNDHAVYRSYLESIEDYKIWQRRYYPGGDYYSFLESMGYATSETYIQKLKSIEI